MVIESGRVFLILINESNYFTPSDRLNNQFSTVASRYPHQLMSAHT